MAKKRIPTIKLDKNKIKEQISIINSIASKHGWVYEYDKELDQLFYSMDTIPNGNFIFTVSDEFSLYVDAKSNINGVVIEYFKSNFVEHQKEVKGIKKVFKKDIQIRKRDATGKEIKILNTLLRQELKKDIMDKVVQTQEFIAIA